MNGTEFKFALYFAFMLSPKQTIVIAYLELFMLFTWATFKQYSFLIASESV